MGDRETKTAVRPPYDSADVDVSGVTEVTTAPRSRRRAAPVLVVVSALALSFLVAIGAWFLRSEPAGDGDFTPSSVDAGEGWEEEPWRTMPHSLAKPTVNAAAVWTGQEMIVLGGAPSLSPQAEALSQVASFDPAAWKWRELGSLPYAAHGISAVWTGSEVVVWGGVSDRTDPTSVTSRGAVLDPVINEWRDLPAAPITGRWSHLSVWTGREVLMWGGLQSDPDGETLRWVSDGAAYDPVAGVWREIPKAPLPDRLESVVGAWTGMEFVVWAGRAEVTPGTFGSVGAAYDPVLGSWSPIADAPLEPGLYAGTWAGGGLVVVGGVAEDRAAARAAIFDPAVGEWRQLPSPPGGVRYGPTVTAAGDRLFVYGGDRNERLGTVDVHAVLDLSAGKWERLVPVPLDHRVGHVAVWTGAELLVFGGAEHGGDDAAPIATGVAYRP